MKASLLILINIILSIHITFGQVINNENDTIPTPKSNNCVTNVRTAQEFYLLGDFKNVELTIKNCVDNERFSNSEFYEEALVLLANNYVAMDKYDEAKVYIEKLIDFKPTFQTRNEDLLMFQLMVEDAKLSKNGIQVSSVSKVAENLYEAPASVFVITEEIIRRRGYMDFEQLLHDLPGFDISRSNGILYSHIYQRGYRSNNTNRILFLVDGVEENDLWGNIVYLSRQYPLSNIKTVEVVYGPTSTIYGPNAFLGVINIITKNPREITGLNKDFGISAEAGYGANNTRYGDITVAVDFPKYEIDLSVTARYFRSDEPNFSDADTWQDFVPWNGDDRYNSENNGIYTISDLYSSKLNITDSATARTFYETYQNTANQNYFNYRNDSIFVTPIGLNRAIVLDNQYISRTEEYQDFTESTFLSAKLRFNDVLIGIQSWYKREGLGVWFSDVQRSKNAMWSPKSTFAYIKYDKQIHSKLSFSSFARYKLHGYHPDTYITTLSGYRNGGLPLDSLLVESSPSWNATYFSTVSNQVRIENRLYYTPTKYFSLVAGLENRLSTIQDNYATLTKSIHLDTATFPLADPLYPLEEDDLDIKHYFWNDIGFFTQATYRFGNFIKALDNLNINAGFRIDRNRIWDREGYGFNFSPRIVAVYNWRNKYIAKFSYAEAYKTPTNFDLYSTVTGLRDVANANLAVEDVYNLEVSLRRFLDKNMLSSIEVQAYQATYANSIETRKVTTNGTSTTQFQSVGQRFISGIQATADYRANTNFGSFYFWGNYTYTDPVDETPVITNSSGDTIYTQSQTTGIVDPNDPEANYKEIRIGDIASHQFSLGINYATNGLNANIRMNWIGQRYAGGGTNVYDNPFGNDFYPYMVFHGAASYHFKKYGITVQGVMNNFFSVVRKRTGEPSTNEDSQTQLFFNTTYYSPGLRTADIDSFSGRLPQNPAEVHIKLKFNLQTNLRRKNIDELLE